LWAVFLYRLSGSGEKQPGDPALFEQLRALPYEGVFFLRTIGTGGNLLCWKEATLRPRDLEGLVERVATVPAFARACADLQGVQAQAIRLAAARFGSRFDERSAAFTGFGGAWRLGAAFLSLPWPLPQRPWQFLSRELLRIGWVGRQTAIVAKRNRARSGAPIRWGRRLIRPLEDAGSAVQEYPLFATARSLAVTRALLAAAEQVARDFTPLKGLSL
jgi:hypothetical protein